MQKRSRILIQIFMLIFVVFITGCDAKDSLNKPKTELRTMIIGGVPVHDHDYILANPHQALNAVQVNSVP